MRMHADIETYVRLLLGRALKPASAERVDVRLDTALLGVFASLVASTSPAERLPEPKEQSNLHYVGLAQAAFQRFSKRSH